MAKKIVIFLTAFVMLFAVVGLAGCSSDNNEDLLTKLLAELYALRAQVYALQTEVGDLSQQQQELLDRIAGLERDIYELTPWTEVPFTVRAFTGWGHNKSFFCYSAYEKTRPERYESMDRNSDDYIWRQNAFGFAKISSIEELNLALGGRLLSLCLLQLYTEEFFEENILILYDWVVVSLNTFSYIDYIKIRNTILQVNVSQFVNVGGAGAQTIAAFFIEVSRECLKYAETAKIAKNRFWNYKWDWNSGFSGLPLYRDHLLTNRW